jgi:hypothetical protein
MILWTLETIFWIEREEGKKEGMLITNILTFSEQKKMLFCHTSKALVVRLMQNSKRIGTNPSSHHPSIHPSIQTGAFVGAAGSLVANSITIT